MKEITVYAPGTLLRLNDVTCRVLAFQVEEGGAVSYRVVWWVDRSRESDWVSAGELEPFNKDEEPSLSVKYLGD